MRAAAASLVLAFAVAGSLTACGESRHCEHDATDQVVDDKFCEAGTAGYEWEEEDKKSKKRKKKRAMVLLVPAARA